MRTRVRFRRDSVFSMSFGQSSGPAASGKQLAYLLSLIKLDGHDGFRDALGPLGLTQRQAGGKFSVKEASTLIDQLINGPGEEPTFAEQRVDQKLVDQRADLLRGVPADALVAELERRGWVCHSPHLASV